MPDAHRPDLIRGYAGSSELSKFIATKGLSVRSPKMVVSTAEKLSGDCREMIERVFGTRVYDYYGSGEFEGIAGECNRGLMHIMFNNLIETLDCHGVSSGIRSSDDGNNPASQLPNMHVFYFKDWVKMYQLIQEDMRRVRILAVVENLNQSELHEIDENTADNGTRLQSNLGVRRCIPKDLGEKRIYTRSLVSR
jgi:hypothetical protein